MSNYQRLISYIYEYEGGTKGRNIGFAKLETRGGQCKVTVSIKKIYAGGNPMGVYLLSGEGEMSVGSAFVRNGACEFRSILNSANVEGSGLPMSQFYGLSVHETDNAWRSYTTIWEDAVAHAAELELADVTSENAREQTVMAAELTPEQIPEKIPAEEEEQTEALEVEASQETEPEVDLPISREIEEQLEREEKQKEAEPGIQNPAFMENLSEPPAPVQAESLTRAPLSDGDILRRLEEEEQNHFTHQNVWSRLRKQCPKIQAFDYEKPCEILTIKPQDIGLLPRETWIFGNNSFLLHGYYNYRYLILARLENGQGSTPRYLLGVPGHYYSNEKYMATMFGFANFVLSKNQPPKDGRFGYWYTDIKVGD